MYEGLVVMEATTLRNMISDLLDEKLGNVPEYVSVHTAMDLLNRKDKGTIRRYAKTFKIKQKVVGGKILYLYKDLIRVKQLVGNSKRIRQ